MLKNRNINLTCFAKHVNIFDCNDILHEKKTC